MTSHKGKEPKICKQATIKNLLKRFGMKSQKEARQRMFHSKWKFDVEDFCICAEWDGKGLSTCGVPCPVHNEKAWEKKQ